MDSASKKQGMTELEKAAIIEQLKWAQPLGLKRLALMFDVHPNTMRKWLKKQVVRNEQMSPRYWRVAIEDLPADLVINALCGTALPDS